MRLSTPFVSAIVMLTAMFSEIAIAQSNIQCNYTTDIDQDNDGLIEICDLDALNAIRYQLDGSGYRESFDVVKITAGCPQSGCNGYELRGDLDFNSDDSYRNITNKVAWTSGLGWLPIGDRLNFFTARFEGNGHTIANLYINRPSDYVGLFNATTRLAKISDLVLSQINIKGNSYIGSLAGHNAGGVAYIGVEGGHLIAMGNNVGGLFGANEGTILNGDVILERVEGNGHSLGGLVGYNDGNIRHSVANTSLSGVSQVGGLVGLNFGGVLADSRADGSVKGRDYIAGLVGLNRARISASNAEAKVISEGLYSGGLVGANDRGGRIADSRASGAVSGNLYVGGLVGWNKDSEISNSFTVNRVDANSDVGGLVGWNEEGQISNTYADGFVDGVHRVGGLVGSNKGIISNSFANGQVVASGEHVGGLIGWNYANQTRYAATVRVIHSYWDSEATEILVSASGSSRTTAQLKSPTASGLLGETFERWDAADWEFGNSEQYPILRHSEGSNRGHLLPGQHIMLSGLLVLDGLTLSPAFNPQTFDYRVNLIDDSVREIRFSPTIANSTQTISVLKDEEISSPSVHNGETVSINLNVVPEPTLITIARHYRIWVIRNPGLDATINSNRSDHRVNEGQSITFNVSTSEPDLRRVSYRWHQVSPLQPNLLEGSDLSLAELNIDIPDDFVARDADETSVVLQVEVRAVETTVVRSTTMTVVKTDSGSISTLAAPLYREGTLAVAEPSEADLSIDADGGMDTNSLHYQWQYKLPSDLATWQDIENATQMHYEISQVLLAINDVSYRVSLDYRDKQGHRHRVVSEPLLLMKVVDDDGFSDIYYLEDLDAINNQLNGKYELVRDLDFNSDASYRDPSNREKWTVDNFGNNADTGWLPIGKAVNLSCFNHPSTCFMGTFEGNGYTIRNLQINRDDISLVGLFGAIGGSGTVRNLKLLGVRIETHRSKALYVGGLAGENSGTILNSGIIGGKVEGDGSVSGQPNLIGGLVGWNNGGDGSIGDIYNSFVVDTGVSVRGTDTDGHSVGGLVGRNIDGGEIHNSYADVTVSGYCHLGGLAGNQFTTDHGVVGQVSTIKNSYANVILAQVSASCRIDGRRGKLVGFNNSSDVINSYVRGSPEGIGLIGGSVGTFTFAASYWDSGTSVYGGRSRTPTQLQLPTDAIGIYVNWSTENWDFGTREQYPILKYALGRNGDACGMPGFPQCGELISPHLRYGLSNLATADNVALSPRFDATRQNQSGIYVATVRNADNTIRFIPTAIEPTADISFYIGDDETSYDRIRSGETSKAITLKENFTTRIGIEVQGTQTVRYTLYIDYQNTSADRATPINYLEDLRAIHNGLTGSYKLARDLDFADNESYLDPFNRIFWAVDDFDDASDMGWVPIGNETKPFAGSFDGNGYTISGLQINRDTVDNQSLFGVTTSDALISNIGLLNVKVEGGAKVAGLISINQGQVGYSYVVGSIESKLGNTAGGLVASNDGGDIIGSYAISEVFGSRLLGGLVGDNRGTIINSHADSIIMPDSGSTTFGGLVGRNRNLIANSYATGKILASNHSIIGGLVGWNDSRVVNGYASVSIVGSVAGGLIGYNIGSITNSYAIGELKRGGNAEGSLVGSNDGGTIAASYWNTDTIANRTTVNLGIGQNTTQLQSGTSQSSDASRAYYKWSDSDWHFGDMELYPILKHTSATESVFVCGSSGSPQCGDLISPGFHYGLRSLTLANDAIFSQPFNIERLNQSDVYFGTVISDHPSVQLIPAAIESTARISIIATVRETIDSHDTSLPISLKEDEAQKVIIEVKGTQTIRYTLYLSYFYHPVTDKDNDGLVDIDYLEDLDAIRHQLDGSGYRADADSAKITSGCPSEGCKGYELLRDLDFNNAGSYRNAEENMGRWTGAGAWQPIAGNFVGMFSGNNKTIANLRVRGNGGLFVTIGSDSRATYIDGIGLSGVDIKGNRVAGIATSCMRCTISNSYVIGNIDGINATAGLINIITASGGDPARISNSYFIGNLAVNGQSAVGGGLIGDVVSDLIITNSYAVGRITGEQDSGFIGGLVGVRTSSALDITNSYASVLAIKAGELQGLYGGNRDPSDILVPTVDTSYLDQDISETNVTLGEPKSTVALQSQSPMTPDSIYEDWDSGDWDFGTDKQYPAIKYNLQADTTDGDAHCGVADVQKHPAACRSLLRHQGSLLQGLKLSEGAGLSNPFSFALFDYGISMNADRSTIRLFPTAFNPAATVEVFKDGNLIGTTDSGEWTVPIPLNDSIDTVVGLVVKNDKRRSYRYRFIVSRLNIVAQSIDEDGDGLIDISDAMHLNAIRHRLDGSAYQHSEATDAIYCSNGCIGYELTADIDLAGIDWQPMGHFGKPFTSVFKGNGHTISNLTIKMGNTIGIGLFGAIGGSGRVENVGLLNVNITANNNVGSITGYNFGTIINSYADGKLVAIEGHAGGLVGRNIGGTIVNSYADVDVRANSIVAGGLVGIIGANGSIVNSYAFGDVQVSSGIAGGLVGTNDRGTKIHNSYAIGDVRTINGVVGGLTASDSLIVNSYYRAGAVISGSDSLIGTDKTAMALKAGVPSDDIYTGWDRVDWHFGNMEQYPALLYTASDDDNTICRQPSPEQLSDCNGGLSAGLSEHDKAIVCRSHLPRLPEQRPYCGALLPGQRAGLIQIEFSENARLFPEFNPNIYDYDLVVGTSSRGTTFRTTPTAYYGSDKITVDVDGLSLSISNGRSSLFTLSDDLDSMVITVRSASHNILTRYTVRVLHNVEVVDGLIPIDYLDDLNLMRYPLAQVSTTLKDCPIDTKDNVRRCKGYKLTKDLDFKDPASYRVGRVNPTWATGAGWKPIGDNGNPFSDLFSGNAHTITNLRINDSATGNIGLFGVLAEGARIENIGLLNVDIDVSSQFNIGALVGENSGEIVNSYVIGDNVRGTSQVGGLVGRNLGVIVNSFTGVTVTGAYQIGGLVGLGGTSSRIYNSYATGDVSADNHVGGLVGLLFDFNRVTDNDSRTDNSYATGDVSGNTYVGGLIGRITSNIVRLRNNYAIGVISGASLCRRGFFDIQTFSCNGGLIGFIESNDREGIVDQNYWDVDTSKQEDDGDSATGVGKTTAELQTPAIGEGIYSNWDSSDWYAGSRSQYPTLKYTSATDIITRPACQEADNILSEMPMCGTLLPVQQRTGLSNLARSNRTGQVLLLSPDFNSGIYDYELIVKSGARQFSIIPYTFNPNAVVTLNDDSGTNPSKELRGGQATTLIVDNINGFLLTLSVEDPVESGMRTTIYSIRVIKHPFIAVNDIDEDDDGLVEIRSAEDLNAMRYQLDGSGYRVIRSNTKITVGCPTSGCRGYELAASIDLSDYDWHPIGSIDATTLDCNNAQSQCFAAVFDGNQALGYEISGLSIVASKRDDIGLFAALADSAQVRNVNLSDVDIRGRFSVGSLAAYNAGVIDNSYANGTVAGERMVGGLVAYNTGVIDDSYSDGMVAGEHRVGGLVSYNAGVIDNSYAGGTVAGERGIGGLVAINDDLGRIFNSYAYGEVSGRRLVGGLVARNASSGMIANSYSLNRVSGNSNIGGLVAFNLGAIANTYASGVVEGATLIGGLVGDNGGSVRNSYATTDIVCTGVPACTSYTVATGGLIGSNVSGGITMNSYWDVATSNIQESAGGAGKTTLQLQFGNSQSSNASRAYYQWSNSDWHFGNIYQYPILKYTSSTESVLTGLQSYGLESLLIAEAVELSPNFSTTKLYYRVGVDLDANIQHLHLIPNALDKDAIIRIVSDNGFDETVKSGTSSSEIVLHSTDTTVISVEVSGERPVRYWFEVDYLSSDAKRNVDTDKDGLIEILTLEDLDAMRNALDGSRLRYQNDDGVLIDNARGCPITGCRGYELLRDLDFDDPTHYRAGSVNPAWTTEAGWQPIGTSMHPFATIFKGNGYKISNLRVNRPDSEGGLFGVIDGSEADAIIEGVGLTDVDIVGGTPVGGLVGYNRAGDISQSYVSGHVTARGNGTSSIVGGLVGSNVGGLITRSYSETQVRDNLSNRLPTALAGGLVALNDNRSRIENSYAIGSVIGSGSVGGLIALNQGSSEIINSYAVSKVIGIGAMSTVGGLVARSDAMVSDSYWDIEVSGVALSADGNSTTTVILQSSMLTSPTNSIYRNWDASVWDFADANRYPVLKAVTNMPVFAPTGKSLLQSLTLSDNVWLFPSFHPLIFDYQLIAVSGQMTEVRADTTSTRVATTIDVVCSDGLVCSSGIPASFVLDGSRTPQITITTNNPNAGELSYNFSVSYAASEIRHATVMPATIVSMPLMVAEGERVRLTASYDFALPWSYRYRWRQSVGNALKFNEPLSSVDTQSAVLDFTIPSDVVAKQDDSRVVELIAEIGVSDDVYISKAVSLIVSKRNNDTADRIRVIRSGGQYTYRVQFERGDGSNYVDQDGGFLDTYIQWQRRRSNAESWVNVASGSPYTIPNEGDYQYRALAIYEDNQGYRQRFESEVIDYLDIDDDNDGLIEIRYLEELDAIRHQPNGTGYKASASASRITAGCPLVRGAERCRGYELVRDLDFNNDESYRTADAAARTILKNSWVVSDFTDASDSSWQPGVLNAVFNGNGHTISNLQINRSIGNQNSVGLFFSIGSSGRIENLGLVNPAIKGLVGIKNVGGIAGRMQIDGRIVNSYVIGDVAAGNTNKIIRGDVGASGQTGFIGGMVGWNKGLIINSYAKINVVAEDSGTLSNKQVRVGGLVGRNIDGGKIYNSYATGEVKGPCIVGGLVGNQFSSDSATIPTTSEIKNSYTTGNVETGFGACSSANNRVAGGLVGANSNSTIENSYTLGKISGAVTLDGLIGRGSAPSNSYWNYDVNDCGIQTRSEVDEFNSVIIINETFCFRNSDNPVMPGSDIRFSRNLQSPTSPNFNSNACVLINDSRDCTTYMNWSTANWDFGTNMQYPALKHGIGLDTNDPGCGTDTLPSCDLLLSGQRTDTLLLNSMSISVNSQNVQLAPSFDANKFNYEATIKAETLPVVIKVAATAAAGAAIAMRRDGGSPLPKESDGTVDISANDSFNLTIETTIGNTRKASYQIQVRLEHMPQPNIFNVVYDNVPPELSEGNIIDIVNVVNGSTPVELGKETILLLNEGDTVRLDASTSLAHNSLQLDYRWSQVSGQSLLSGIQTTLTTIEFTVPVDFVARDQNDSTMVLKLELIESALAIVSREVPILVRKINNGNAESAARWVSSDTLSASDLSDDIDGGSLTDINYRWLVEQNGGFVEIAGANQKSYTLSRNARNAQYRLSISYTDGQGHRTTLSYDAPLYMTIEDLVDKDNDGLIEIETLEDLDAIRYQSDGSGYRTSSTASKITAGCPDDGCKGYELVRDLDFLDDASYSSTLNKAAWTSGSGWQPIGTITNNDCSDSASNCFNSILEGNGYSISNLRINRGTINEVGLFAGNTGNIRNLGLSAIEVTGNSRAGGLVGRNEGQLINVYVIEGKVVGQNNVIGLLSGTSISGSSIINSYVYGAVTGVRWIGGMCGINNGSISKSYAVADVSAEQDAGGLVGENQGSISNTYVAGSVSIAQGKAGAGGLLGVHWDDSIISNSYSTARVESSGHPLVGGLIGRKPLESSQDASNSYWDIDTSGQMNSPGSGIAQTTEALKMPTAPGTMENNVYYTWDTRDWDFGTSDEYPALKYDDDTCDTSMPSPDCGKLLLAQRIGLRDLKLEQNGRLHLSPDFDPAITIYTVSVDANASELKITPIAANPDASILVDGKVLPANSAGYTIALNTSEPTSTVISVAASNSMRMEQPVVYKLTINNNRLPRISINAPASIVEGETLIMNAAIEDPEGDKLSYSLTTAPNLLPDMKVSTGTIVGPADLRYELNIPSDLLDEMPSMGVVDIVMTVDDGSGVVSETVQLTIVKENNGVISVPTPTLSGFTYTIGNIDLSSDTDGINLVPEIVYQWQKEVLGSWSDIDGATDASYTVEGVIDDRYRVLVDYTDKQGYRHRRVASAAVSAPQQFIYNVVRSRDVVRNLMDQLPTVSIQIRVFLEGLLR